MVISILVCIMVVIVIKKCWNQQNQKPPVIQMSAINNNATADVEIEENGADVKIENNPAYTISTDVRMQSNPAYQIMQKDDSCTDKDDYYY